MEPPGDACWLSLFHCVTANFMNFRTSHCFFYVVRLYNAMIYLLFGCLRV